MADIYVASGMQADAETVEAMRLKHAPSQREHGDHSSDIDVVYSKVQNIRPAMWEFPSVGHFFSG